MKSVGEGTMTKDRININIFLSSDVAQDDGFSDNEGATCAADQVVSFAVRDYCKL